MSHLLFFYCYNLVLLYIFFTEFSMLATDDDLPGPSIVSNEKVVSSYMPSSTENHCCALLHGLQELRKSNTLCDYTLIADGQVIYIFLCVCYIFFIHDL